MRRDRQIVMIVVMILINKLTKGGYSMILKSLYILTR